MGRALRASWSRIAADQRGSTLALVAVTITAMLGMAALAVDVGLLMTARGEVQNVADLAALAGAGTLIQQPHNAGLARQTAIDYAAQNNVRGLAATVEPGDVDVDLAAGLVRVRMFRTRSRGTPISTFFARVLGVWQMDVAADAAAQVFGAAQASCPLPIALPDRWINAGRPAWNPAEGDAYVSPGQSGSTGYADGDLGRQIVTHLTSGPAAAGQGNGVTPRGAYMWMPSQLALGGGASQVRGHVIECQGPLAAIQHPVGKWIPELVGNLGALEQDLADLVSRDPHARFDPGCDCVTGGQGAQSPRIRPIPLFDPLSYSFNGAYSTFQVSNFAGVFVEQVGGGPPGARQIHLRFVRLAGEDATGGISGAGASLVKTVRLVE